jgi:hypothetical protein
VWLVCLRGLAAPPALRHFLAVPRPWQQTRASSKETEIEEPSFIDWSAGANPETRIQKGIIRTSQERTTVLGRRTSETGHQNWKHSLISRRPAGRSILGGSMRGRSRTFPSSSSSGRARERKSCHPLHTRCPGLSRRGGFQGQGSLLVRQWVQARSMSESPGHSHSRQTVALARHP